MKTGHKKRQEVRKRKLQQAKEKAQGILNSHWQPGHYTPETIQSFYKSIISLFDTEFTSPNSYQQARIQLLRFIKDLNASLAHPYPEPPLPVRIQRAPAVKQESWMKDGKELEALVESVYHYWAEPRKYKARSLFGWLLFSAMIGGLNDRAALLALVKAAINKEPFYPLGPERQPVLVLKLENEKYGNDLWGGELARSVLYWPDPLTRIWLHKIYQHSKKIKQPDFKGLDDLLEKTLKPVTSRERISSLVKAANYLWETQPGVRICPALARVLQGKQKNCSLSAKEWARYFHVWNTPVSSNLLLATFMTRPQAPLPGLNTNTRTPTDEANQAVTRNLRQALNTQGSVIDALDQLAQQTTHEGAYRLILWIKHLASQEGSKRLKKQSVLRYMDAVAHPWLASTAEIDVRNLDAMEFEDLYQDILGSKSPMGVSYDAQRLNSFHSFQVKAFGAPEVNIGQVNNLSVCRARLINGSLFHCFLTSIYHLQQVDEHDKSVLQLIYILAYRTGMRSGEILSLQLRDVEHLGNIYLLVRANAMGGLKTSSAYRRIPLTALLKPHETQHFQAHLHRQQQIKNHQPGAPLFTLANSNLPVPAQLVYGLMKHLFKEIMGQHDYTFHSFRHTALSQLALVLEGEHELLAWLSDYQFEDIDRVRRALLGQVVQGQDHWYALAHLAGHLTPAQTFESYLHLMHLLAYSRLAAARSRIPASTLRQITGYSTTQIARVIQTRASISDQTLRLDAFSSKLNKQLKPWVQDWSSLLDLQIKRNQSLAVAANEQASTTDTYTRKAELMMTTLPGTVGNPITMEDVAHLLKRLEAGEETATLAGLLGTPYELVERWFSRAQQLIKITTSKSKPRLFEMRRVKSHPDCLITPAPLTAHSQTNQARRMFQKAAELHASHPEALHDFLKAFVKKVQASRSGIRFTRKQTAWLKEFLETGSQLLPASHWRLHGPSDSDARALKKQLNLPRSLVISDEPAKDHQGYTLTIIHPDEGRLVKIDGAQSHYSSAVLKYVCHLLLVTDECFDLEV